MTRDDVIGKLRGHADELRRHGVVHLALFGSRARGDEQPDSDLDVLIELDEVARRRTLLDIAAVNELVSRLTGLEAHAIERASLQRKAETTARTLPDTIEVF